jgi:hypothetical protein
MAQCQHRFYSEEGTCGGDHQQKSWSLLPCTGFGVKMGGPGRKVSGRLLHEKIFWWVTKECCCWATKEDKLWLGHSSAQLSLHRIHKG